MFRLEHQSQLLADYGKAAVPWTRMLVAFGADAFKFCAADSPLDGRFSYPVDKRRTEENIASLRKAESNLDAFWLDQDRLMESNNPKFTGTFVHTLLTQPRALQRTPVWVEPIKNRPTRNVEDLSMPVSQLYVDHQHRTQQINSRDAPILAPKAKVKTHGVAKVQTSPTNARANIRDLDQPNPTDPQPQIFVDERALKVFSTLFFNPSISATPGEVKWKAFRHAFSSIGFTTEKLHGSAWRFSPTNPA